MDSSFLSPEQAYKKLGAGVRGYLSGGENLTPTRSEISQLSTGQKPFAAILTCADSRVSPELIFQQSLGQLFVVRVAGNIATSEAIASLEYTVANLGTPLIVVMGHSSCGAVGAAIENASGKLDLTPHLQQLVEQIQPSFTHDYVGSTGISEADVCSQKNAHFSAQQLRENSQVLSGFEKDGKLKIVSAFYNLSSGEVQFLDEANKEEKQNA